GRRGRAGHGDPVGRHAPVRELLGGDLAETRDDLVAERARRERRVRLHQRHGDARVELTQGAGAARAGEAAADDHHARGALRAEGSRQEGGGRRDAELEKSAPTGVHFWAAYQAAIAWISGSVNPLAIRSMTVPGRVPARNSCMARTIAA